MGGTGGGVRSKGQKKVGVGGPQEMLKAKELKAKAAVMFGKGKGIFEPPTSARNKAWNAFARQAKKELGKSWNGIPTGDMIYGGGLSVKAKDLYYKYFKTLP
jgi:hypothetical protein